MTESRCIICKAHWDVDAQPAACTCEDGGWWQLRVDDEGWTEARNSDGDEFPG